MPTWSRRPRPWSRGPDGADQLLCYVVPRPGATPLEKDLRALLKDKVADPAQPAQILVVASLPKDEQGVLVPELLPQPAAGGGRRAGGQDADGVAALPAARRHLDRPAQGAVGDGERQFLSRSAAPRCWRCA
ncbi:MAG: hypothetical protein WDO13_16730 [Verrucomicrobiota bacterium]